MIVASCCSLEMCLLTLLVGQVQGDTVDDVEQVVTLVAQDVVAIVVMALDLGHLMLCDTMSVFCETFHRSTMKECLNLYCRCLMEHLTTFLAPVFLISHCFLLADGSWQSLIVFLLLTYVVEILARDGKIYIYCHKYIYSWLHKGRSVDQIFYKKKNKT